MGLRLYNTLTRKVEPFEPLEPGRAGVYACGPTIYGFAHVGNFRTFLFYDLVHRVLDWSGHEVNFVMNFTDVDDKTIRAARERGATLETYTQPFADAMLADSDALGIRRLALYPRATAYVDRMVELVSRLLARGHAYVTDDGSVWYDISSFPDYGKLSGRDVEQGRQGERVAADEYAKEDARDFALWKAAKPEDEEVGAIWDAPWGRGRPGWHLECSAMALAEVGETLDLHLGGEDLVFPHHEDEIAQSEGATGKPFARFWLHVKHLRVEGEKMAKSAGNFFTVRELLDEGVSPAALRHLLLSAHYRSELNFTREGLAASARAVERLLDFEARLREGAGRGGEAGEESLQEAAATAEVAFREAILDDLNVPEALAALFVFVTRANRALDEGVASDSRARIRALELLEEMDQVLGLLGPGKRFREVDAGLAEWVEERIRARAQARADRDWAQADAIREELTRAGVVLEDSASGTRWKRAGEEG
jgi:cysteinyl-tRNA synthetase